MKSKKLTDISLQSVGTTLQMVGAVYASGTETLLVPFPDDRTDLDREFTVLNLSKEDWMVFLRQADHMEIETASPGPNGEIIKAMVRKSQRQVDQNVSWSVFRRDGCRCRWCGTDSAPLTVDHLITWETGGPSTEINLVSSCKACNRTRGDMTVEKWLKSEYYIRVSRNLIGFTVEQNAAIPARLKDIRRVQVKAR